MDRSEERALGASHDATGRGGEASRCPLAVPVLVCCE